MLDIHDGKHSFISLIKFEHNLPFSHSLPLKPAKHEQPKSLPIDLDHIHRAPFLHCVLFVHGALISIMRLKSDIKEITTKSISTSLTYLTCVSIDALQTITIENGTIIYRVTFATIQAWIVLTRSFLEFLVNFI